MSAAISETTVVVSPDPTDEEAVAIVAAIEMAWPRPAAASSSPDQGPPRWRFSGRWWSQPTITSRRRP